jgi:hypothetical protein
MAKKRAHKVLSPVIGAFSEVGSLVRNAIHAEVRK